MISVSEFHVGVNFWEKFWSLRLFFLEYVYKRVLCVRVCVCVYVCIHEYIFSGLYSPFFFLLPYLNVRLSVYVYMIVFLTLVRWSLKWRGETCRSLQQTCHVCSPATALLHKKGLHHRRKICANSLRQYSYYTQSLTSKNRNINYISIYLQFFRCWSCGAKCDIGILQSRKSGVGNNSIRTNKLFKFWIFRYSW